MICAERERLALVYRTCVERFREAVFALKDLRGTDFDQAYRESEGYRTEVDKARTALDQHRTEHRC